jgi:RsiW-degrading membrane proteinase PrsW (M82 family)
MPSERNKLPSVLMLVLSTLGILISFLAAGAALLGSSIDLVTENDALTFTSLGTLALVLGLLNIPAWVYSIRHLRGKPDAAQPRNLFRNANFTLIVWVLLLGVGYYLTRSHLNTFWLAPVTIACVIIPIWWLVEFARRGLVRPTPLHEWGALTMGLTLTPLVIMTIETLMVVMIAVIVIILLGLQSSSLSSLTNLTANLNLSQGGIDQLDQLLYDLAQNPTVAAALYLVIGFLAPFTEEFFKPLIVWLSWKRPMQAREGFSLGLISGGAFTLLESASLVSQINPEGWLSTVVLRASTGLLHIGLSGLVGYGIAKARQDKGWGKLLLTLLGAAALHGLWNSMALLNGFSSSPLPMKESVSLNAGGVISLVVMLLVFAAVLTITIRLNARLRKEQLANEITDAEQNDISA